MKIEETWSDDGDEKLGRFSPSKLLGVSSDFDLDLNPRPQMLKQATMDFTTSRFDLLESLLFHALSLPSERGDLTDRSLAAPTELS